MNADDISNLFDLETATFALEGTPADVPAPVHTHGKRSRVAARPLTATELRTSPLALAFEHDAALVEKGEG